MNSKLALIRFLLVSVLLLPAFYASAAMSEVTILDKGEIVKLSDEQLMETYIDIIVELEASKAFHTTSGFTPKSYTEYKDLLKYRLHLLMEIRKRGLELPITENTTLR
jgi:hypothetical protein